MKITAHNPEVDALEKAYIASDVTAGDTSLVLTNNQGFANTDKVLIGGMGEERSEIQAINGAISGDTDISISATDFPHNVDDPVYKLQYDQAKFYRSTTGIDGTYSALATVDIDVDNEDQVTQYEDSSWDAAYFYKVSYVNSVASTESELSDPISAVGYSELTAGDVIDKHIRKVRDRGYAVLGVEEYLDIMDEVNKDLITQARKPWDFLKAFIKLSTVADQNYVDYSVATDLWKIDYISYDYSIGGSDRTWTMDDLLIHKEWINKYANDRWTSSDDLIDIGIDTRQKRLLLGPSPRTTQANVITLYYWKDFTRINSLGDIIETPNDLIYLYKMREEFYRAKAETDSSYLRLAKEFEAKYGSEIVKMQRTNNIDGGSLMQFKGPKGYKRRYTL